MSQSKRISPFPPFFCLLVFILVLLQTVIPAGGVRFGPQIPTGLGRPRGHEGRPVMSNALRGSAASGVPHIIGAAPRLPRHVLKGKGNSKAASSNKKLAASLNPEPRSGRVVMVKDDSPFLQSADRLPPVPEWLKEGRDLFSQQIILVGKGGEKRVQQMHYYDSLPGGRLANGEKPLQTVLFIPGFMGKGGDLVSVVRHLLLQDPAYLDKRRIIIVELPGRGKSQDPLSMGEYWWLSQEGVNEIAKGFLSIDQMKSAVEQLMDKIIPMMDGSSSRDDVVVVGESMGGHIAALLVKEDKSGSPGGALLVNPYGIASPELTKGQIAFKERGENWMAPLTPAHFVELVRALVSEESFARMKEQKNNAIGRVVSVLEENSHNILLKAFWPLLHWPLLGPQKKRLAYMEGALQSTQLTADSFHGIPKKKKLVTLNGMEDGVFHWSSAYTFLEGHPNAKAYILEKAGHLLFKERPDMVAKYLLSLSHDLYDQG